jgi:hypothetical protein
MKREVISPEMMPAVAKEVLCSAETARVVPWSSRNSAWEAPKPYMNHAKQES